MTKSLEEIALEETVGAEAAQKLIKYQGKGLEVSDSTYLALDMIKELGAEKYKQAYNYLLEKIHLAKDLDTKKCISIGIASLLKGYPGAIIFYKELANELAQPEGKRDETKIRSNVKYFDTMITEIVETYYEGEGREEGK